MSRAYYNENDKFAAAWLRELIARGLVANGDVDERSITEVTPDDVAGYTQCHWFAGIGGWSYALRLARWPDDREVWTGSCPCQPFSPAGRQQGTKDARHLWPFWLPLIAERRPVVVFGEQVEAAINHGWLDLVCADLEREDYAVAAVGLPAASVGAPHRRQRLWFVADTDRARCGAGRAGEASDGRDETRVELAGLCDARKLAHPDHTGPQGWRREELCERASERAAGPSGPFGRAWADADWLPCADGKWRPVESGSEPLAHGAPARVGRLRGYGNAIVPQVAAEVIRAYMACRG